MKDERIPGRRFTVQRKRLVQMAVHGEKDTDVSENMVSDMLIDGDNICQDGALQDASSIISKTDNHNGIFRTAQRSGTPVLSGAAVITVEKADIPGQGIPAVRCSGIYFNRQGM